MQYIFSMITATSSDEIDDNLGRRDDLCAIVRLYKQSDNYSSSWQKAA